MMLAAEWAKLGKLQTLRRSLLILHGGVVLPLALTTLQCDLFSCHITSLATRCLCAPFTNV